MLPAGLEQAGAALLQQLQGAAVASSQQQRPSGQWAGTPQASPQAARQQPRLPYSPDLPPGFQSAGKRSLP